MLAVAAAATAAVVAAVVAVVVAAGTTAVAAGVDVVVVDVVFVAVVATDVLVAVVATDVAAVVAVVATAVALPPLPTSRGEKIERCNVSQEATCSPLPSSSTLREHHLPSCHFSARAPEKNPPRREEFKAKAAIFFLSARARIFCRFISIPCRRAATRHNYISGDRTCP